MNRKNLVVAMAFAMSLSAPLAFAQDAATDPAQDAMAAQAEAADAQASAQDAEAAAQDATAAAQDAEMAAAQATDQAAPAAQATDNRITWADLDADKNGSLTKEEASSVQALSTVFDDADTDKDGALTPDEYKAFVATQQAEAAGQPESEG